MMHDRETIRRQINSLGMRDGEPQESKIFATIGKCMCIWLLYKHADQIISHENVLFVLMLFLIMPDLIKKFLTLRFGGSESSGYTEQIVRHDSAITTTIPNKAKVDNPDA